MTDSFSTSMSRADKPLLLSAAHPRLGRDQTSIAPCTSYQNSRKKRHRVKKAELRAEQRRDRIAVLDMETDPFDSETGKQIIPFLAVLYTEQYGAKVIWQDMPELIELKFRKLKPGGVKNSTWIYRYNKREKVEAENKRRLHASKLAFARKVRTAIEELPDSYLVYAHNGGKFDFMFLMSELRGSVSFKGRALMSAKIGAHELRDSLHILPVSLEQANRKDAMNYDWMRRDQRDAHKKQIIDYCVSDCRYLLEVVKDFIGEYGNKLSIGQAAISTVKKTHDNMQRIHEHIDGLLRPFYHGGRVECLEGAGHFGRFANLFNPNGRHTADLYLYDVNSMYPAAMARFKHPIGAGEHYFFRRAAPEINDNTCFLKLRCENKGALLAIDEDGTLTSKVECGEFCTTIHEYNTATELGLISNVELIETIDCALQTDFSKFVLPFYAERQTITRAINDGVYTGDDEGLLRGKRRSLFLKLILNNAYGKFAQDPRHFKECFITDPNEQPPRDDRDKADVENDERCRRLGITHHGPDGLRCNGGIIGTPNRLGWGTMPATSTPDYWIWERPALNERGYYNVGTAASITGAARAMLMRAIHHSDRPIYCDTDSLLCERLYSDCGGPGVRIDDAELGAWKLEGIFAQAYLAGKKSYGLISIDPAHKPKVRHKGGRVSIDEMIEMVINDAEIETVSFAPTIGRDGSQTYIRRVARVTAKRAA